MVKFYKVSHGGGFDIKVIQAMSKYEALGYYVLEVEKDVWLEDVDEIEEMSPDEEIEVSCVGFPICETLEEIAKKKEFGDTPQVICELVE